MIYGFPDDNGRDRMRQGMHRILDRLDAYQQSATTLDLKLKHIALNVAVSDRRLVAASMKAAHALMIGGQPLPPSLGAFVGYIIGGIAFGVPHITDAAIPKRQRGRPKGDAGSAARTTAWKVHLAALDGLLAIENGATKGPTGPRMRGDASPQEKLAERIGKSPRTLRRHAKALRDRDKSIPSNDKNSK